MCEVGVEARDPKGPEARGPVERPVHGLGPVAPPERRALPAATLGPAARGTSVARPMAPPIARVPAPAAQAPVPVRPGLPPPTNGGRPLPPQPGPGALALGRRGFGLPNLRRNVCPHFYMTGVRGAIPIQAPHLLKALVRQELSVSRCQLRGGVHMEQGYVNDVCLSARFNQCVFYEDDLTR